jgi:hypothetical protein
MNKTFPEWFEELSDAFVERFEVREVFLPPYSWHESYIKGLTPEGALDDYCSTHWHTSM